MRQVIAALLLATAFGASAFAADEGSYIGADRGQSSADIYSLITKTGTAISALAGYQFKKYVAAQDDDFSFPAITGGSSFKDRGYSTVGEGILPFNDQWALLGRLGYAGMKVDSPFSTTKSDLTYGIAGQYSVNQAWGVRLNYDMYTIANQASQKTTTGVLTVGGIYRF
jgi:hypothetical protein